MSEAVARIQDYVAGMSRDKFMTTRMTADAVVRNLEILGEAANRLPGDFKARHADVPWPKIIGLRHRIVHDYFDIDLEIVWQIIQQELPSFKQRLDQLRVQ
jgi:uncharacterized protein with HEPN domain